MKQSLIIGHLPILDHLILGVAEEKDKESLNHISLNTEMFSNWKDIEGAMKNKEIDGAFLLFPLALEGYRTYNDTQIVLLGHREGQVLVTEKNVHAIQDLKEKNVLIPHKYSTHHILLHKILESKGMSINDVHLKIADTEIKEVAQSLGTPNLSAFMFAEPLGTAARHLQTGNILELSHNVDAHHIDCVLVLRKELIDEKKEVCQELVDSLVRAGMFINSYPRQAAEVGERFLGWPKKLLLEALTHDKGHISFWDLLPRQEDLETIQDIAVDELHLWKEKIDLSKFIYPDFAKVAYKEWTISTRKNAKDRGEARTLPGNFKESINRFIKTFPNTDITGLAFTAPGEKYPKEIPKVDEIKELFSIFLNKVFEGQEFLIGSTSQSKKAYSFFQPSRDIPPDRVLLRLSLKDALKCAKILHFGDQKTDFCTYNEDTAEETLVTPKQEIVILIHGDNVFCSFGYTSFRFLTLMLQHYK